MDLPALSAEQNRFLARAIKLHEDDRMIAFEHPDHGDGAPVMVYDKRGARLIVRSPFYDLGCPEEYHDWLDQLENE